ncbi:DUF4012 domain-containing protein [Microbacterium sp. NIBRBAC000506063]|uniref:DUF4012 domain-containing protein n=1 Tax=Microbacterium sp. NIBRBAC000506063 TaxID=2734618 RepID=UPI001CB6D777|nr:DUF4012 domain-containing protein [Microbacterium sp. NIBRBAC000506063]
MESITRITADSGVLERRSTISARTVPRLSEPLVADLDENLSALLPAGFDTRLSDASSVPDFPTSARLIAAHWEEEHGGSIDGVIAVDVATLARVLAATGPTTVGDYALSGASLVETLTERIPLEAGSRSRQSDHFSRAVRAVLVQAFATEDPGALVAAIAESAADGGIRIWSAHTTEQEQFAASDLGACSPSPTNTARRSACSSTTPPAGAWTPSPGPRSPPRSDPAPACRSRACRSPGRTRSRSTRRTRFRAASPDRHARSTSPGASAPASPSTAPPERTCAKAPPMPCSAPGPRCGTRSSSPRADRRP